MRVLAGVGADAGSAQWRQGIQFTCTVGPKRDTQRVHICFTGTFLRKNALIDPWCPPPTSMLLPGPRIGSMEVGDHLPCGRLSTSPTTF